MHTGETLNYYDLGFCFFLAVAMGIFVHFGEFAVAATLLCMLLISLANIVCAFLTFPLPRVIVGATVTPVKEAEKEE